MFCPKCGEKNVEGAAFCSKCGANFEEAVTGTNNNRSNTSKSSNSGNVVGDAFKYLLAAFLRPAKAYKTSSKKMSTVANSLVFAGILWGITWILSIISSIFIAARVVSYSWSGATSTVWNFERIRYAKIIFVNLFVYAALIAAIAGIYCVGSIVVKKTIPYCKMLVITCTSIIPFVVLSVFLAPLCAFIHQNVVAVIGLLGVLYSVLIFFNLIREEIQLKSKEKDLYLHLVCAGILFIIFYFVFINFGSMNVVKSVNISSLF